jgi:hypothetical protein
MNSVQDYLESRFSSLEANGFWPICNSPCRLVRGTLRAYNALSPADRRRYRKLIARSRASIWCGGTDQEETEEAAWHSKFLQSCFPLEYPDSSRELARAKDLRKVAKLCFEQLLGAKPERSQNPGDWVYEGRLKGWTVSVELRYACTMTQIGYGVRLDGMRDYQRVSAESLYGLGLGNWNRIYLAEIDQAFALLRDLVTMVVDDHAAIAGLLAPNA